jgi:hypothetical protein
MYFSLITPTDGRERDAAHEWASGPYIEHQWLWRLFPAPEGAPRDFLTVIDATAFAVTLRDGIGPAKAFGCGLMLVRRR